MQGSDKRFYLSGIDYFQLLIDHHNKKNGGLGHEARLALFLEGRLSEQTLRAHLAANEHCRRLARVRIDKTWGLGYPSIVFLKQAAEIPVVCQTLGSETLPDAALNVQVPAYSAPPLHIQLLYLSSGNTCVLFTFHHILFDYAGVEAFIASLTGTAPAPVRLLPEPSPKRPFYERFNAFFRAVAFTFKEANFHMTTPERPLPAARPRWTVYRELVFSPDETRMFREKCRQKGALINPGAFQLACSCKALHDQVFSRQRRHRFIWVPVPVNVRRKGAPGAILSNGLSFLFYKLRPADLATVDTTLDNIQRQMKAQMRKELPRAFIDFADGYWYMPLPIYYPMFNLPSWGRLSSFSFSTLGNSFPALTGFMGLRVLDVVNYPSNSIAPGLTLLFYEFRGQLRLMSSWVKDWYTPDEQTRLLEQIKSFLVGA